MASPSEKRRRRIERRKGKRGNGDRGIDSSDGSRGSTGSSVRVTTPRDEYLFSFMDPDECRAMFAEGRRLANESFAAIERKAHRKKASDLKDRIRSLERLVKLMKQKAEIQEEINAQLMDMALGDD